MTLAEKITLLMDARMMSQVELSRMSGTGEARIRGLLNGKRNFKKTYIIALAYVLEVDAELLSDDNLGWDNDFERAYWDNSFLSREVQRLGARVVISRLLASEDASPHAEEKNDPEKVV